jgi:hypothetical protein
MGFVGEYFNVVPNLMIDFERISFCSLARSKMLRGFHGACYKVSPNVINVFLYCWMSVAYMLDAWVCFAINNYVFYALLQLECMRVCCIPCCLLVHGCVQNAIGPLFLDLCLCISWLLRNGEKKILGTMRVTSFGLP